MVWTSWRSQALIQTNTSLEIALPASYQIVAPLLRGRMNSTKHHKLPIPFQVWLVMLCGPYKAATITTAQLSIVTLDLRLAITTSQAPRHRLRPWPASRSSLPPSPRAVQAPCGLSSWLTQQPHATPDVSVHMWVFVVIGLQGFVFNINILFLRLFLSHTRILCTHTLSQTFTCPCNLYTY